MNTIELEAKVRKADGSRNARRLRRSGQLPAVLYGHGMTPLALEINYRAFAQILSTKAGGNAVIQLKAEGAKLKESTCLIKDLQHDPVTDLIQHVDFTVISLTEKIEVEVPIIVKNAEDCAGVKAGGILDMIYHEIEVTCLPTQIPESITVDVKVMQVGDSIHARDLKVPEGVSINLEPDEVVIAVHAPRKEEVPGAEGAEAATQPEVIEKGKKPEEGEAAPAAAAKPAAAAAKPAAEKKAK
ncbi:MAG TPA: 50S ribosomal protein L25/general stress protein Ctc [Verrucomicrobiae bacterium]|jgi:large subunit ribosomal protein L25|nr:50S ribosomal protein L25/general stress protein Ctc [Verrucomicrobiae bacterium]